MSAEPRSANAAEAAELFARFASSSTAELCRRAERLALEGHGARVTWSPKVFIPLTRLCRDHCGYCTFVRGPRAVDTPYLLLDQVLAIARAGAAQGCREALFTLGDRPEARHAAARDALAAMGFDSTVDYLVRACRLVLDETGLLPHVNAGLLDEAELARLRAVAPSQGLMLESVSDRLGQRGGPHQGCVTKRPSERLRVLETAGRLHVPFTSGLLIGIGETRLERIETLLALRDSHARHGHLQEVIVQNFLPKHDTRMSGTPAATFDDLAWTIAVARLVMGPAMTIQVPPNLSFDRFPELLHAGMNDWGGVSPVTPDHVNPEAAWPSIERLSQATGAAGRVLVARLTVHPRHVSAAEVWIDPGLVAAVQRQADAEGLAREDDWVCGSDRSPVPGASRQAPRAAAVVRDATLDASLARCLDGEAVDEDTVVGWFGARGGAVDAVCAAADAVRARLHGDRVSYVVNRNINYTNVCSYSCTFCAFSKRSGRRSGDPAYDLALDEVARRAREAWDRGATEVCMQGGIHPDYTGDTYLALVRAVREAVPQMHVHAFSPLEIHHGAQTLGLSLPHFLERLMRAGLGSLPGTAAEILDDTVRARICPDKVTTAQWLAVMEAAHRLGLASTSTIMFGHVESPRAWARHLMALRDLQAQTGGFTEFVPLPFVHMEAPMALARQARPGPTWREVRLMHAVGRLVLQSIPSVQASWPKLGPDGAAALLAGGVNDLGGTLMNESISRAAGAGHGQELPPGAIDRLITAAGRVPWQRTTRYQPADPGRQACSHRAAPLAPPVLTPPARRRRSTIVLREQP